MKGSDIKQYPKLCNVKWWKDHITAENVGQHILLSVELQSLPVLLVFKCLNDLWSGFCGFGEWSLVAPSVLTLAFETIFCLWVCVGKVTVQVQLQASSRKISCFSSKMDHQLVLSRSTSHYSWASLFFLPFSTGKSIWKIQLFISLFPEKIFLFFTDSPTSDFFLTIVV